MTGDLLITRHSFTLVTTYRNPSSLIESFRFVNVGTGDSLGFLSVERFFQNGLGFVD